MGLRGNQGRASCTGMRGGAFTVQSGTQRVWVCICAGGGRMGSRASRSAARTEITCTLALLRARRAAVACEGVCCMRGHPAVCTRLISERELHGKASLSGPRMHTHAHTHTHDNTRTRTHNTPCIDRRSVVGPPQPPFALFS